MLLSPQERKGLITRPSNSHERATNDVRVRRKLAKWLKDLPDIALIFEGLPTEQLRKELDDSHAFNLLDFAIRMMQSLDFDPIYGEVGRPEYWQIPSENAYRPAEDKDIERSFWLDHSIEVLKNFYGSKNPVGAAAELSLVYSNPRLRDRLTEGEKRGVERVNQVMDKYKIRPNEDPK